MSVEEIEENRTLAQNTESIDIEFLNKEIANNYIIKFQTLCSSFVSFVRFLKQKVKIF